MFLNCNLIVLIARLSIFDGKDQGIEGNACEFSMFAHVSVF
jgi:hypothetical protein